MKYKTIWLILLIAIVGCSQTAVAPTEIAVVPTNTLSPRATPTDLPTATVLPVATNVPVVEPVVTVTEMPAFPLNYTYQIINTYPHDPTAFTQGLIYQDNIFYEGTGLWEQSTLRKVMPETGEILQSTPISNQYFGEGITIFGDRIIQLTWQSQTGFVYDKNSFELLQTFNYPTEGWGITHDGKQLIMSDGTDRIYFWDPDTLTEIGHIDVTLDGQGVNRLNELEYINGEIWANIWQTDFIVRIDPATGQVTGVVNLTGLLADEFRTQPVDVLNGIAYDAGNDRLFVTGKLWPQLFEIKVVVDHSQN
jgi:glutamine cyclotransferase